MLASKYLNMAIMVIDKIWSVRTKSLYHILIVGLLMFPNNIVKQLWKHAYSNILKISPPKKNWKYLDKNSDIFHISAQNMDC